LKNINDLKDDDFTESMQENEEGEMGIPSTNLNMEAATIKDVNDGDFRRTSKSVLTHSKNTNATGYDSLFFLFIYLFIYLFLLFYSTYCLH